MRRHHRLLALIAAIVCLAVAAPSAYLMSGRRWATGRTVTMFLQLGNPGGALADGATSWDSVAAAQIDKWNQKIGSIDFKSRVEPRSRLSGDGVNDVFWDNQCLRRCVR